MLGRSVNQSRSLTLVRKRMLRPHQRQAFEYTKHVRHPALFMEMRLGKTLVCIRRCLTYAHQPAVLVFAPNSALGSWEDELDCEDVPWLRLTGTTKERNGQIGFWHTDTASAWFVLTNKESHAYIGSTLANVAWDAVVIDESHCIKSPGTKITKFMTNNFREVPHRWLLTGTPNPEDDSEFFPQMQFLHNRFMDRSNFWSWREHYYKEKFGGMGYYPRPGTRKAIRRAVGRRCFVMTRKDAGLDREKIHEIRWLEFDQKLQRTYDIAEDSFALDIEGKRVRETIYAGEQWQWLRQICGGVMAADGRKIHSLKLKALCELVAEELSQEPVVVWFAYNEEIYCAAKALAKRGVPVQAVTGETPDSQREAIRRAYMRRDIRVVLLQQAIAQTGMDLSRGDIAVYYSHPSGYVAWRQTQDRILTLDRTGSILYVHLLFRDTVDEDLYLSLGNKRVRSEHSLRQAVKVRLEERRCRRAQIRKPGR